MTITEFINARIDEKRAEVDSVPEWHCTDSARGEGWGSRGDCPLCEAYMFDGNEDVTEEAAWEHLERVHRRSRVLAECRAMQTIMEQVWKYEFEIDGEWGDSRTITEMQLAGVAPAALCAMAAIWSDHEDFDPAWQS